MSSSPQDSKPTDRSRAALERLYALARPRLGVDPRALGAFRIVLGVLLLADLAFLRAPGLVTFYTDDGVFPRSALADAYPTFAAASLHAVSGAAWVQGLLFAIAGVAAACLLAGYRTKLSLGCSLLLLASLFARNPYVVNGGDTILLTLLFLGLFLPLEARWSLGGGRRSDEGRGRGRPVYSLGTAILCVHFVTIYAASAVHKFQSEAWLSGTAVPRIFHLEEYTVLLGPSLAEFGAVLTAINWLWVAMLSVSPFLICYTGRPRTALAAAFVCAHLGMAATMRLGVFPFVMIAGLLLFFPAPVWDRLEGATATVGPAFRHRLPSSIRADRTGEVGRILPDSRPRFPRVRRAARVGSTALLVGAFVAILLWQAASLGIAEDSTPDLDGELSDVSWSFFAPNPPDASSWYAIEATLESGETIDAVDGGDVAFDRPPDAAETYPTTLWHRYGVDMRYAGESQYEPAAAYVCEASDRDLESVTIYHLEQSVDADGPVGDPVVNERITRSC
ncbi:HTTM domain protein [Haloterrigena turkmenica DSM 5511]|uniref:HTTM domain protein n=1 Tax=Haloterrigena turkmenica (strain ATCC 51198 / DSM 5511 / JCM 9101 / NCIMB 13204 / VKM B-1734 / 4k) TaxID=543526 RepID=D2RRC8_HALTV|nr:HTTM domain-containing protein [Haloterrigena turkmenica]ADB60488.1 HTTM domain protein [Haloterrigena turkmenica DSM 5511]